MINEAVQDPARTRPQLSKYAYFQNDLQLFHPVSLLSCAVNAGFLWGYYIPRITQTQVSAKYPVKF